jgi:hypothetical protein
MSGIDIFCGMFLFRSPGHKEESQCEEVDKLYDADETETHKEATDAAEVTCNCDKARGLVLHRIYRGKAL